MYKIILNSKDIFVFDAKTSLRKYFLEEWKRIMKASIIEHNRFTVALSGGTTPLNLYKALAEHFNDGVWSKTHIFLADERFVSNGSRQSNINMIQRTLLEKISLPKDNLHPVCTDTKNVQEAAAQYESELFSFFAPREGAVVRFDLIVLGIGEDGHTASLFPGTDALTADGRLVVATKASSTAHARVSLTLPVINNAHNVIFVVTGSRKKRIIKEIINDKKNVPAALVHPQGDSFVFLLDKEAAAELALDKIKGEGH